MICCTGKMTKKKIAIISGIGGVIIAASYVASTINPAAGVIMFAALPFLACLAMCAAIGGAMWFSNKFAKKKSVANGQCCDTHSAAKQEQTNSNITPQ